MKKAKQGARSYAGAAHNRLTSDWVASSSSQDSELLTSLRPLRNRSRQLCRDNDYARGAVRTIVNNIVGKGMTLQAQVKRKRGDRFDENINLQIEELWADWSQAKYCHTAGKLCFSDIERLIMRSVIESGEVLIRLVPKSFDGSPVSLAIEVIEADQLADEHTSASLISGIIRMGVEVDEWQRPIAYWLYPNHPGDYQFTSSDMGSRLRRIPSNEILHLHLSDRPGQTRGVPWFHSALLRLRNVGGYEEAELVAARAQASVMGFIQSPDGEMFGDGVEGSQRLTSLEPGAIEMLAPGETFSGFAPTRPNMGFDPFVRMMLRGVATGIGMSYEALSRDYSNTSYSSARTALLDERDNYRIVQDWLIKNFNQQVYLLWLEFAVMSGALSLPGYELNPRFYQKVRWVARGWQWVDPQNEVAAYKEAIKAGFTTTSQVVAQSGLDIEDVLKERRRELDLAKELDIAMDTTLETAPEGQQKEVSLNSSQVKEGFTPVRTFQVRAKTCKKGIACGGSCIAATKTCKSTLTSIDSPKKEKAKKAVSSPSPKATKKPTTQQPDTAPQKETEPKKTVFEAGILTTDEAMKVAKLASDNVNKVDEDLKNKAEGNKTIWCFIAFGLDDPSSQGLAIKSDGKVEAGAIYKNDKKNGLTLEYLATHPDNVDPKNKNATKGAGTKAMAELAKIATSSSKKGINLKALPDAVLFYKKMGFKVVDHNNGYPKMNLSHKDALALIARIEGGK